MSKKLLRDAFSALKVNEPLNLGVGKPTPKEAPQNKLSNFEKPKFELPKTELTQNKSSHYELPQKKITEPYKTEAKKESPPHNEASQNKVPQKEITQTEKAQDEKPRNDVPQIERAQNGYFKLAHSIFCEPRLKNVSGDCFRLFLWMSSKAWRYSNSDGTLRASISFIEQETGMSHASVSRAFKNLKELGLIKILETDFKKGNLWEVSSIAYGGDPEKYHSQNEPPQTEVTQNKTEGSSKIGTSSLKMSEKVTQSEGEYKKYLININNSSKSEKIVFLENETEKPQDSEIHEALELFESELSDEYRKEIISEFKRKEYPHEFYPPEKVIRSLVAYEWAKLKNTQDFRLTA